MNANGGLGELSEQIRLYERALELVVERYGESSREHVELETTIAGSALVYSSDPSIEPRVVDGAPVEVPGVKTRFSFDLEE